MAILIWVALGYVIIRALGGGKTLKQQRRYWLWIIGVALVTYIVIIGLALWGGG
jgi:hypothetical protein